MNTAPVDIHAVAAERLYAAREALRAAQYIKSSRSSAAYYKLVQNEMIAAQRDMIAVNDLLYSLQVAL